ncbi:dihydrofolate reductase family protein [Nocardia sp. NPDC051750]|jgi:dihydrofolate reductase|uniref:dihydrofolate reductase family protein n=1 Tax=Nocardia sp. NPDC051750 TaxID=3364325 RepID=UPI003799BE3D
MGSVTLWMQISLDGFAEGPDEAVHWPVVDEELCTAYLDELRQADLLVYGRKTYEIMAAFWPTADLAPVSPFYVEFARFWRAAPKLVVSRTLRKPSWNTQVIGADFVDEVNRRKEAGQNMVLLGGAETAAAFLDHDLVDEYRLFVHPMLLRGGVPLFRSPVDTAGLRLMDVLTFDSAVVQMHYRNSAHALC